MNNYDLLVIGNGFDINFGYKTKYSDFFEMLKSTYNYDSYDSFFKQLNKNGIYEVDEDFYLGCIEEKENYFIKYFIGKNELNYNWCDIESELMTIVKSFDITLYSMKIYDGSSYIINDYSKIDNDLILDYIGEKRWGYLSLHRKKGDLITLIEEDAIKTSSNRIRIENKEKLIERIAKSLYSDFSSFKQLLKKYLICISKKETRKKLLNEKFELITYNYTAIAERISGLKKDKIYYIHGDLNGEIVLGIESGYKFKNKYFSVFEKSTQSSTFDKGKYTLEDFVTSAQDIAYIGLSFDKNDSASLRLILSYEGATHTVFYFDENDRIDKSVNIKQLIDVNEFNKLLLDNKLIFKDIKEIIVDSNLDNNNAN